MHRDGVILDANAAARRMFGFDGLDSDRSLAELIEILRDVAVRTRDSGMDEGTKELTLPRPDGSSFPAEIGLRLGL